MNERLNCRKALCTSSVAAARAGFVNIKITADNVGNYDGFGASVVSAFGTSPAISTQLAAGALPTALGSTTVKIKDSAGTERMAP
ncbi:MAG TPA: hypothetical protein PLD20_11145 [Blastocatellia bacterium]|nr:hypothetical protein [Blastocatellia bacterium]HMX24292.1 hypothetical protein [Blastocatellia bacterium]HMY71130.1 hypothetical protein [Blastocatellia bacterium]HMZ18477.1 hypothetical protein [Blastocatellia bacterium]HNG28645.1 hypothetical protein [Blastocatellia bacterium]